MTCESPWPTKRGLYPARSLGKTSGAGSDRNYAQVDQMGEEGIVDRRKLIEHYLRLESMKANEIPAPYPNLSWGNVNALDEWLGKPRYKVGVISGFRSWAVIRFTYSDLLECAIVNHIFPGRSQRLGDLLHLGCLEGWKPPSQTRYWYQPIEQGASIPLEWALIIRRALPSEGATFYIEDGSGRATWFVAQSRDSSRTVAAYIGFDPDPASNWLRANLDGYFVSHGDDFRRREDVVG